MSDTCREFGSKVNVHELDCVPFFSLSTGFKCFHCIMQLEKPLDCLTRCKQNNIVYIFVETKSVLLNCFKKKKKNNTKTSYFFPPKAIHALSQLCQSVTAAVSMIPFLQSTEMAQLKALLLVMGRKKVCEGSSTDSPHGTLAA